MHALYSLFAAAGDFLRAATRLLSVGAAAANAAAEDAERRLELPAALPVPVAVPRLPLSADPDDPDAKVPATRRPSRNGARAK